MDIHHILKKYWGYDAFRTLQEDIIASVLSGHDTLGMLPTGGGKSIAFQVPALALGGLTIVVTPLISLMKDQCDHLVDRGIRAAAIYMGMSHQQVLETYERVIAKDYRFLYVSPERLETQLFLAKLQYMDVRLLVVDEAHCISQWGYDFRPPYLRIADLRPTLDANYHSRFGDKAQMDHIPVLALTATATETVIHDIQDKLRFRPGHQFFKTSFERPNLTYSVIHSEDKRGNVMRYLNAHPEGSAIVYVRNRLDTQKFADDLALVGISATFYHAGLPTAEKQLRQDQWMQGQPRVIVATNAFGMGIDKPDVRFVFHIDLPPSPEEYFQEAGRAGRDGQPAQAILIISDKDLSRQQTRLEGEYPEREFIRRVYQKLSSFFQVAIGAGYNALFEFNIYRFCSAYGLPLYQTHYALRLLHAAGYIAYLEDPDRHSRAMFICSREHLYHIPNIDTEAQRIINAMLRLYTGLFADYVWVNEEEICRFTHLDPQTLYDRLLLLGRLHILHYIPARQVPAIMYLTPRLDTDEIRIHHSIYEDRRERQEQRLKAMTDYAESTSECRLVLLLRYFGENLDHRCGHCDVCLSEGLQGNIHEQHAAIASRIITLLHSRGPLTVHQLLSLLPDDPTHVAEVVRQLTDEGTLRLTDNYLNI